MIALLMADEAGVAGAVFRVTVRAISHFHTIPGMALPWEHSSAPDVPAIAGQSILFVNRRGIFMLFRPVAGGAFHLG